MMPKVYIDGQEGTTGLQIHQRLTLRHDITLLTIDPAHRKDTAARQALMNQADVLFLCLPDVAAVEAVALVTNPATRIIDASTAHRVTPGWVYGFPELQKGQRAAIAGAQRVANPGCHATGFLAAAAPLAGAGVLPPDYPATCYSLTGYSGGGKAMISEYEAPDRPPALASPNIYALSLQHKHLPEMQLLAGLTHPPVFSPILGDIPQGMATALLLHNRLLTGTPTAEDIWRVLAEHYRDEAVVTVAPFGGETPRIATNALAGRDRLVLTVCGHGQQTIITAQLDNLGKGASGAAIQNMNLLLGLPETAGLALD